VDQRLRAAGYEVGGEHGATDVADPSGNRVRLAVAE
jgi:hypothetical protein